MRPPTEYNQIPVSTNWANVVLGLGIIILMLAAVCVAVSWTGALAVSDSDASNDVEGMMTTAVFSGFVLPLAIVGGLMTVVGLVFRKPQPNSKRQAQACPECGRENALTTRICPRCSARLMQSEDS